jgi:hypothetical protein
MTLVTILLTDFLFCHQKQGWLVILALGVGVFLSLEVAISAFIT